MMRKTAMALVATAALGLGSTAAFAHGPGGMGGHMGGMGGHFGGMGGGHFGGFHHCGGFHDGFHHGFHRHFFVGVGFGGFPYDDGYYPYYDNNDDEGCYLVRRRVLTPYGWRIRRVEVCG